jgi:hypothetical protein
MQRACRGGRGGALGSGEYGGKAVARCGRLTELRSCSEEGCRGRAEGVQGACKSVQGACRGSGRWGGGWWGGGWWGGGAVGRWGGGAVGRSAPGFSGSGRDGFGCGSCLRRERWAVRRTVQGVGYPTGCKIQYPLSARCGVRWARREVQGARRKRYYAGCSGGAARPGTMAVSPGGTAGPLQPRRAWRPDRWRWMR